MIGLFAAKSAEPWRLEITKAHLRGAIWLMALALFVLLPKPLPMPSPRRPKWRLTSRPSISPGWRRRAR